MPAPTILAVHLNPRHTFSKYPQPAIQLLAGLGVEGDAHCGATVRHQYLRRRNASAPNRTQVHLLAAELLDTLNEDHPEGAPPLLPGRLGENLTTLDLDLLPLPLATRLHLGASAVLELTGLRTPCSQLNKLRPGLMKACFVQGTRRPRAGVMAIVLSSGVVQTGDSIQVELPPAPHCLLGPV